MQQLAEAASRNNAWACYDCGKCTATCPISRAGGAHSPRRQVLAANLGEQNDLLENSTLYHCLTCSLCDERCPAEVGYTGLVQRLREVARGEGVEPDCPHGGALQSVMRMMARGDTQQDRMQWLDEDLKTDPAKGEVFYCTGCAMYFDALFGAFPVKTLNGVKAAIRLMNRLGVTPVVSPEERCCGHDLLWNGDRANFELLAKFNVKLVKESGADLLVTSCAECLRTWKEDYEPYFDKKPVILHITEYLGEHLEELQPKANGRRRVTFQDPCRLGRHLGVYDPPRKLVEAMDGVELVEMRHSKESATCCAGGTWSNCDRFAKQIQVERLREARATGADVLATSCPKCQIHLACAMKDPKLRDQIEIEICDVAELLDAGIPAVNGKENSK